MEVMKHCPFCGGRVKFWLDEKTGTYNVHCKECGCDINQHATSAEEAIALWNTRGGSREKEA